MSDLALLARHSAAYFLANLVTAAIPFALIPILTRNLSTSEYGQIAAFQILVNAVSIFAGLSTDGAVTRKNFDTHADGAPLGRFIAGSLQVVTVSLLIVGTVIYLARGYLASSLELPESWIIVAIAVSGSTAVIQICMAHLLARSKTLKYTSLQIAQSTVNFSLSAVLVAVYSLGAEGRVIGQALSVWLVSIVCIYYVARSAGAAIFKFNKTDIEEIIRFGLPLIPHAIGMYFLAFADRIIIQSQLGLAELGVYAVAAQVGAGLGIAFDAINKAYVPWLYARLQFDTNSKKRQTVLFVYRWYAVISVGIVIGFFAGPTLISIVAGPAYSRAGEAIGWILCGYGFWGMYLIQTNFVFYSKRTGLLAVSTSLSGLINIALLAFTLPRFGIGGAGFSFAFAMLARFLLTWYVAQKRYPMPWFDISWRKRSA